MKPSTATVSSERHDLPNVSRDPVTRGLGMPVRGTPWRLALGTVVDSPQRLSRGGTRMAWDFSTEPEFEAKLDWMRSFVREEIIPLETLAEEWRTPEGRGDVQAHHRPDEGGGQAPGPVGRPPAAGDGRRRLRPGEARPDARDPRPVRLRARRSSATSAPDSGNAELIAVGGTPEQKEQWMQPLLDGKLRSCFSMTEPGAGADPTLLKTAAVLDGDEWVINGHKWFSSNASISDFLIVMCMTNPDNEPLPALLDDHRADRHARREHPPRRADDGRARPPHR